MSIRIIHCRTGLPESNYIAAPDFLGDKRSAWSNDTVFRVVCSQCGLIDKAATRRQAESIGGRHRCRPEDR